MTSADDVMPFVFAAMNWRDDRRRVMAYLDRACAEGVPALSLSVEDGNEAARRLYDSRGFATVGRAGESDTLLLRIA